MAALTVSGSVRVPGDKSISHRALILAALAAGKSRVRGILDAADVRSTAGVLRALGADFPELSSDFVVTGRGLRSLAPPKGVLDCGNSGTTARLVAGVAAAYPFASRFEGDESLSRRPMRRVARPLAAMGARVDLAPGGTLPMTIEGARLASLEWSTESASAQVKSAVLLAGLVAGVEVTVREPVPSRDHTERMLAARGIDVRADGAVVTLRPAGPLRACDVAVPADPSSAAFLAAFAALADGGEVELPDLCLNPTRTGFLRALARMGARVNFGDERHQGGEVVGSLFVAPAGLRGIAVGGAEVPSLIDELPLLACVASRAEGETVITGAAELRVKESDRIAAVVANLRAVGAAAEELPDGLRVAGGAGRLRGEVRTFGDHRIAMAFGVLGALPGNEIRVDDRECVGVSYPDFWLDLNRLSSA